MKDNKPKKPKLPTNKEYREEIKSLKKDVKEKIKQYQKSGENIPLVNAYINRIQRLGKGTLASKKKVQLKEYLDTLKYFDNMTIAEKAVKKRTKHNKQVFLQNTTTTWDKKYYRTEWYDRFVSVVMSAGDLLREYGYKDDYTRDKFRSDISDRTRFLTENEIIDTMQKLEREYQAQEKKSPYFYKTTDEKLNDLILALDEKIVEKYGENNKYVAQLLRKS